MKAAKIQNQWAYTLAGYFVIVLCIALLGACFAFGMYWAAARRVPVESMRQWLSFLGFTGMILAAVIKQSKTLRSNPTCWYTLATLLLVHSVLFAATIHYTAQWRIMWFYVVFAAEIPLFLVIVKWATRSLGRLRRPKRTN